MMKFYSDYNQVKLRQVKALLDEANIPSFVKNEFIQGAAGEIPPHEALPEVWLIDAGNLPQAQAIVDELERELAEPKADWRCDQCGESNEGQFKICWQCQHAN